MSFLLRLFRPHAELSQAMAARVKAWRALPALSEQMGLADARWVVLDSETSGLNVRKDRLLSVGAYAIQNQRVSVGDGFAVVLRQEQASARENVLIHGIAPSEQAAGAEPDEALMALLEYAGRCVWVAYHAGFDRLMLARAVRDRLGVRLPQLWLDIGWLAPALLPEARLPRGSLDDWLAYFGLRAGTRHRATDDALVSAELFLILLARARAQGIATVGALHALAEAQQRIAPGGGVGGV